MKVFNTSKMNANLVFLVTFIFVCWNTFFFTLPIIVEFRLCPSDDIRSCNDGSLGGSLLGDHRIVLFNNISVCDFGIWSVRTGCSSPPTRVSCYFRSFRLSARGSLHVCYSSHLRNGQSSHCILGNTRSCPTATRINNAGRRTEWNRHRTDSWHFLPRKIATKEHRHWKFQKVGISIIFHYF